MVRGDSNMSDSSFFRVQKLYQNKQKAFKKLYKDIDKKTEELTLFQKIIVWFKNFINK